MARFVPEEFNSLRAFGKSPHAAFVLDQTYQALSWNILKSKRKKWQRDFEILHPQFDLLLLQEAKVNFDEPINHYDPEYSWAFGESFALDRCGSSCGVMTGCKIDFESAFNRHGPIREPFLNTPKSTAFTFFPIADHSEQLLVINSHFINFRQNEAFEQQLEQIVSVIDLHKGPLLFAGDFNTWNRRRRRLLLETLQDHNLRPVNFENDTRWLLVLDYVFVRQIEVSDAKILDGIQSSDHLPLSLTFQITV